MRIARWALALLLLAPAPASAELRALAGRDGLRVGFGAQALPAPEGGPLAGYGGLRTRTAVGHLDAPEARAVVLENGDARVAIVAVDLVIVRPELRDALREHASARGVGTVLVAATHTHSGPGGYLSGWWPARLTAGTERPGAAGEIADAARGALDRALADRAPARLGAVLGHSALAENRRRDDGPAETDLPVLVARFPGARPAREPVVVFAFGAHATVLSPQSRDYSADYVGATRRALGEAGWRALFLPGPLGDQQPVSALGPLWPDDLDVQREQVVEIGRALAVAVLESAERAADQETPHFASAERWLDLPEPRLRRFCPIWWLGPFAGGPIRDFISTRAPVQVLRIGPAWLAGVPAEPSSDVGSELRAALRAQGAGVPFVIAHANDWTGYVVTPEIYGAGGYEACMSFHGPGMAAALTEKVAQTARALDEAQALPEAR
ncbi:MAG: hypothetical protein JRG82_00730 [Deltaproteobacteria bacterium]|nr:hypothetical protein [Deltaproteobacteria bacterium]